MPLDPLTIGGLAAQGLGSLFGIFSGAKQKSQAKKINPTWDFKKSDEADQMKGFAQLRLNSRNPYSEANRRSIATNQAGVINAAQRTALDPSQALLIAAASQGQADQSLFGLSQQDVAFNQQNDANFMNALNAGIQQDNMENQFMAEKYGMDMSMKNALNNAGNQSIVGGFQNAAGSLLAAAGLPKKK